MPTVGGKKIKGVNTKMKYGYNSSAIAKYTAITGKSSKAKSTSGTKPIPKVKFGYNSDKSFEWTWADLDDSLNIGIYD